MENPTPSVSTTKVPWNKGKLVGQKAPLALNERSYHGTHGPEISKIQFCVMPISVYLDTHEVHPQDRSGFPCHDFLHGESSTPTASPAPARVAG